MQVKDLDRDVHDSLVVFILNLAVPLRVLRAAFLHRDLVKCALYRIEYRFEALGVLVEDYDADFRIPPRGV